MGLWDNIVATTESATGTLGSVPVLGESINAMSTAYHAGSAVYDGVTGDRDGAINHGAQAVWSGIGSIPGLPETVGAIDSGASALGMHARAGVTAQGGDAGAIPGGLGDLIGSTAVGLANGYFGADDSNWIAPGNAPTGTRGGEIAAGSQALGGGLGGAIGNMLLPGVGGMIGSYFGGEAGAAAGPAIGEFFGSDLAGPTSGARGPGGAANGWAQTAGDWLHSSPVGQGVAGVGLTAMSSALLGPVGGLAGAALPVLDMFDF